MNSQKTLLLFLSLFSITCQRQVDIFAITEDDIQEVLILNKTNNKTLNSTVYFSEKETQELLKEIGNSSLVQEPNIRSNNGYLEIQILLKSGYKFKIDVIETHYAGIIVSGLKDYKYYRNDKLLELITRTLIINSN